MAMQTTGERAIHVLIADGQPIVRKGVCALLASEPDIEVVGEATTPAEVMAQAERRQPDVILMDMMMVPNDGIAAIAQVAARHPETQVLVFSDVDAYDKVRAAIKAGAAGFLLKSSEPEDLLRAIREVQDGGAWLQPTVVRKLLDEFTHTGQRYATEDSLTERELDVLRLVAHGDSNQQIANQLDICEGTVRVHVSNILSKLHLASRTQAALYALHKGLATLDEA